TIIASSQNRFLLYRLGTVGTVGGMAEPVRRGDIYCSSGCGYDCTWASYVAAREAAQEAAGALGRGWTATTLEGPGYWVARVVDFTGRWRVTQAQERGQSRWYCD